MQRINTSSKSVDLFGAGKHGFKAGNVPAGIAPTEFSPAWANTLQEELAQAAELCGLTLDPDDDTQLSQTIEAMVRHQQPRIALPSGTDFRTFRTHDASGDTPDNWKEWKRSGYFWGVADNATYTIAWTTPNADFSNSVMIAEMWGVCVETADLTYRSSAYLRGSYTKNAVGTITTQDSNVIYTDTDGGNPLTVTWSCANSGGAPALRAAIPVNVGLTFNIAGFVIIRSVSLGSP